MTRSCNQAKKLKTMESQRNLLLIGFAVRELLALATVGVRQGSEAGPRLPWPKPNISYLKPVRPVIFLRFPSKQMVTPRAS